ncbi:MAG TPA: ribonuclease III [Acidimicrobiia bacterium]
MVRRRGRKRASADSPYRALEESLGWTFDDVGLLEQAVTHRSYCAEHSGTESNERLEFFGDAVLGLVVTDYVYREYPEFAEGEMAKVRASVVNSEVLADVAAAVGVGEALRLGKGEDAAGGRDKPSILCDAMEAVLAAVYLDGGWEPSRALVLALLESRIVEAASGPDGQDPKGRLQELVAQTHGRVPRYQVQRDGPDHAPRFSATVTVGGRNLGEGQGRSKRQAEQMAAQIAWRRLRDEHLGHESPEIEPDQLPSNARESPSSARESPSREGHDAGVA